MLNTKYDTDKSELDNKIPDISNLATKTALTTIEKKIPDVSNLITKTDFGSKLSNLNRKVTTNKTKHLPFENELNKLKTFGSIYFIGKVILKKMVHKSI